MQVAVCCPNLGCTPAIAVVHCALHVVSGHYIMVPTASGLAAVGRGMQSRFDGKVGLCCLHCCCANTPLPGSWARWL